MSRSPGLRILLAVLPVLLAGRAVAEDEARIVTPMENFLPPYAYLHLTVADQDADRSNTLPTIRISNCIGKIFCSGVAKVWRAAIRRCVGDRLSIRGNGYRAGYACIIDSNDCQRIPSWIRIICKRGEGVIRAVLGSIYRIINCCGGNIGNGDAHGM